MLQHFKLHQELSTAISSGKKIIGWGTGDAYFQTQRFYSLELHYLVDNDRTIHEKNDIIVYSPEKLFKEDPSSVFIVIFSSFWISIKQQIQDAGLYESIPYTHLFYPKTYFKKLKIINEISEKIKIKQKANSTNAIVVQGPIYQDYTLKIISYYAKHYPNDYLVLSTWKDSDPRILQLMEPLVDNLILSDLPEYRGIQNRNLQLLTTKVALEACKNYGALLVMKTRTDMIVLKKNVFDYFLKLNSIDNRILISSLYTRKYVPYHPSDMIQVASINELWNFWNQELDCRKYDLAKKLKDCSLQEIGIKQFLAETYFGIGFCKNINYKTVGSLEQYWTFIRDFFIVVNTDMLDILWLKNPSTSFVVDECFCHEIIDYDFWKNLQKLSLDKIISDCSIDIINNNWSQQYRKFKT